MDREKNRKGCPLHMRHQDPDPLKQLQKNKTSKPLCHTVADCLDDYFQTLEGHTPAELYDVILSQVEPPLLRATLRYCGGNQSRAADVLGLNRATLRKKIAQYRISIDELK